MSEWSADGTETRSIDRGWWALAVMMLWIGIAYGLLLFIGIYTVELYFTVSLVGFLVVSFLFAPPQMSSTWWSRFRWLTVPALLVFGYIILQRVMAVVGP